VIGTIDVAFVVFSVAAVVSGYGVFRVDSMIRATYLLLASFLNVGAILVLLLAEYLGVALLFMMTVEMIVMGLFMVMFMMNPAGLNPMNMVHQPRFAAAAGVVAAAGVAVVAVFADFPDAPVDAESATTRELGIELLGGSMLVFESIAVTLLATMVCSVILSSATGRFGDGYEGSVAPALEPGGDHRPADDLYDPNAGMGHSMHGMDHGDMDMGDMDHGDMDMDDMDHDEMDMGEMGHSKMDHGDMDHDS
jgi:NADH:ubiquinone oxidoreductase subunit 6 (subunit J)